MHVRTTVHIQSRFKPTSEDFKELAEIYSIPYKALKSDFREAAITEYINNLDRELSDAFM